MLVVSVGEYQLWLKKSSSPQKDEKERPCPAKISRSLWRVRDLEESASRRVQKLCQIGKVSYLSMGLSLNANRSAKVHFFDLAVGSRRTW